MFWGFGTSLEQPKNCSKPLSATEAVTYFEFVLALQAGGHRFDPGYVHQPPENQLLKRALFCDFSDFWNLGTITISRALQKPFRRPTVVTHNPIYKDRLGLACPSTLVSLTPYSASRGSAFVRILNGNQKRPISSRPLSKNEMPEKAIDTTTLLVEWRQAVKPSGCPNG